MKHFIVYDTVTGNVLRSGTCPDGDVQLQADYRKGEAVLEATSDAIVVAEVNLEPVRQALYAKIDAEAGAVGSQFVPDPVRAMAYIYKAKEAAEYLSDKKAKVPILDAEAKAVGVTVDQLAAEVIATSEAYTSLAGKLEAARRGAKKAVQEAQTIAEIHAASQINWNEVLQAP